MTFRKRLSFKYPGKISLPFQQEHFHAERKLPRPHKYRKCGTFWNPQSYVVPKQGWRLKTFS